MNGMPPHIAQVVFGHKDITTTMGYKAVYPAEAISSHRAFIARRRALRPPGNTALPPTEWHEFLAHFQRRKVAVGTAAAPTRPPASMNTPASAAPCLTPDPAQRGRLEESGTVSWTASTRPREGWLGEIEGLKVSLAATNDKIAQLDASLQRQDQAVHLGMPAFPDIASRSVPGPEGQQ